MALLFGIVVGFTLGLTGGGGSIFAVPLLVYGLGMPVHEAVGVSLLVVGATALIGAGVRLRQREVEVKAAFLFGLAGSLGAPFGTWLGGRLPARILLGGFALMMLLVAARMAWQAARVPQEAKIVRVARGGQFDEGGPACRFDPGRGLALTSRCAMVLALSGTMTGLLSGLFGVGGGFLIVPALMLAGSLPIHRAVATSLLVIAIVSAAGTVSYLLAQRPLDSAIATIFVLGSLTGMGLGTLLSRRLAGPLLQKVFAAAMAGMALYILLLR